MNIEEFIQALYAKGIHLSENQVQQFATYFKLLVEWNEKVNLTALTEEKEVYLKHFYDSLLPLWETPLENYHIKLCDVGAGAGFPSIPLKIIQPEIQLTIVDSLRKRINFLELLVEELNLTEVELVHARAEDMGQNPDYRGQFDIVTARAVAQLNVLAEFCVPLLKKGGHFLVLKGSHSQTEEEIGQAQNALKVLGAKLITQKETYLPEDEGERTLLLIKKTLDTPKKYPRKAGKPAKQPL